MNNPYSEISNSQIHTQTNERIYNRNIPSQMLQPYLDVRPVMTKYSYFPIVIFTTAFSASMCSFLMFILLIF